MIALTFLIISSIIGAGFATGAELVSFFGNTGLPPFLIAILVGLFLLLNILLIYVLDKRGFKPNAMIFIPIYFVFFIAMTAGISQIAGVTTAIASLAFAILIIIFGFDKLIWVNKWLMFFVLGIILWVTIPNITATQMTHINLPRAALAAIIYSGMNSCMLFPIFTKARTKFSTRTIKISIFASVTVIALFIFVIMSSIQGSMDAMPLLGLSSSFFVVATIFLSIFTSQVISLFNISESTKELKWPFTENEKTKLVTKLIVFSLIAFVISLFGFSTIIAYAYPAVGAFMTVYVITSFVLYRKKKTAPVTAEAVNEVKL
ncbi:MAG: hypothetical protein FWE45_03230 [Firmicutes bacterium]|nr:hypothetical protein [Bacillota bacterium]